MTQYSLLVAIIFTFIEVNLMHLKNKKLNKVNWENALHALIGKSPSNRHHKEDTNGNGEMER